MSVKHQLNIVLVTHWLARVVLCNKGSLYLGLTHAMFFATTLICYQTHTHTHTHTQRHTIHTGTNRLTYIHSLQHLPVTLNNLLTIKQPLILPTPPFLWEKPVKTSKL